MSRLNDLLVEAVSRRYPGVSLPSAALFMPMLDLRRGELSSGAAIELARALRGDAPQFAQELTEDLATVVPGVWSVVAGYMILNGAGNDTVREDALLLNDLMRPLSSDAPERSIICLLPDSTTPVFARLRLVARAALHALLSVAFEGRCRLGFYPQESLVVSSADEVLTTMRAAIDRCLAHEGERRVGFEVPATLCRREAPLVVWTSHHYHDRLPQEVKRQLLVQRGEGRAIIKIPSDGWLLTGERVLADILSPAALAKLFVRLSSREGWLRWVFHFASSANSGDLDPLVALYDECASPRWNAQALYERVAALLPGELARGEGALKDDILSSPLQRRDFALRALFLPSITRRAIVEGEVGAWCSNIEEFARAGHAVLNAPGYRADLKNQVISPSVSQINASLALGCVGIIPLITEG